MAPKLDRPRLIALARPYLGPLLLAGLIVTLEAAVGLVAPRIAGMVVDAVAPNQPRYAGHLNLIALALLGLFALRGLLGFTRTYITRATGARMLCDLRARLYGHLVDLAPDFFEERKLGELLSRIGSDLSQVQTTITNRLPEGIRATIAFFGTLVVLLFMNWKLTLLALVIVPPIAGFAVYYGSVIEGLSKKIADSLANTSAIAQETLAGIQTVQSYGGEETERRSYGKGLDDLLRLQVKHAWLSGAFVGLMQFVGFSAFAIVLWYGARLILNDELTVGELTAFLLYVFSIATSVGSLGSLYGALRTLRGTSARTFEILETRSSIIDPPEAPTLTSTRGDVQLQGLSFQYPAADEQTWALRDLNIHIKAGETVAVVGPSGAGKSTLFSLLLRFRDPSAGAVLIDGQDLRELSVSSVRAAMAIVPQEIFLFSGSIADNICYGTLGANPEQMREAAQAAGAAEFIDQLKAGYETLVGERGVKLSAGQRQRIAIARAFLRQPTVFLLDEATSALDAESEHVVQQALSNLMRDRTTLVIAHRLATARQADRILVMHKGEITASGTHDELFESNPLYQRFWELQASVAVRV